jgi:hypothetical protein
MAALFTLPTFRVCKFSHANGMDASAQTTKEAEPHRHRPVELEHVTSWHSEFTSHCNTALITPDIIHGTAFNSSYYGTHLQNPQYKFRVQRFPIEKVFHDNSPPAST